MPELTRRRVPRLILLSAVLPLMAMTSANKVVVTAAATAAFPSGAVYNAVALTELQSGFGVDLAGDGSADGQFDATLIGTASNGQPRSITVQGVVSGGSSNAAGTATFSGTAVVNMGDGTAPSENVPFAVTVNVASPGTIALTLGATALPAATVADGSVTVK